MKKIAIGIVILIVVLVSWFYWQKENDNIATETSSVYKTSDFHFEIYKPDYAIVQSSSSSKDQIDCCGRVGSVRIPIRSNDTFVDISVYNNQANLERDHNSGTTTMDNAFKQIGLSKTTKTINGKQVSVYYGQHIADVPGGGPSWPDVQAVFIGPTYSYMIDIVNVSSDPNNSEVAQYLNSFNAN